MQTRSTDTNYAVPRKKPQKVQACWDLYPDLCDTGAALKTIGLASQLGAGH